MSDKKNELLFEYQVRLRTQCGYEYFYFYADTKIEKFLNKNNIKYVRNMLTPFKMSLIKNNFKKGGNNEK